MNEFSLRQELHVLETMNRSKGNEIVRKNEEIKKLRDSIKYYYEKMVATYNCPQTVLSGHSDEAARVMNEMFDAQDNMFELVGIDRAENRQLRGR